MGYWGRLSGAAAVAALLSLLVAYPPVMAYRLLHPERVRTLLTPAAAGLPYEEVVFAGQGVELHGWYVAGSRDAGVVLVHGFPGERGTLLPLVAPLHAAGFHLLLYDQRASGTSGGETVTFGYYEAGDLGAAADFLRARAGVRRVGGFGASMGAAVVLLAAGQGPGLDAVVADSPFADLRELVAEGTPALLFGPGAALFAAVLSPLLLQQAEWQSGLRAAYVRPLDAVARISPRPVLLIHGLDDRLYSYRHSVALYEAAGEPKELWLVPGAVHAGARSRDRAAYDARIVEFLRRALMTPA